MFGDKNQHYLWLWSGSSDEEVTRRKSSRNEEERSNENRKIFSAHNHLHRKTISIAPRSQTSKLKRITFFLQTQTRTPIPHSTPISHSPFPSLQNPVLEEGSHNYYSPVPPTAKIPVHQHLRCILLILTRKTCSAILLLSRC